LNNLVHIAAGHSYLWVQGSGTYSPRYSWPAITSDSNFMRSSCRPQSELGPTLLGLAQGYPVATRCIGHCITCVAQDIKGHADLASSPPSSQPGVREANTRGTMRNIRWSSRKTPRDYSYEQHNPHVYFVYTGLGGLVWHL